MDGEIDQRFAGINSKFYSEFTVASAAADLKK